MVQRQAERRKREWRQEDVGFDARLAGADISRIDSGRMKPSHSQVARLSAVLGLRPEAWLEHVEAAARVDGEPGP